MKRLSIIIPMYNSEQFIDKCLNSLLVNNPVKHLLDVVVVNDGSVDKSPYIVKEYIAKYPDSVQLVNKENGGHGSAINAGIEVCKGRYIKVVDADDWVQKEGLINLIMKLENCNAEVVVTNYQTYNIMTKKVQEYTGQVDRDTEFDMQQVLQNWAKVKGIFCIHGLVYERKFYQNINKKLPEKVFYDDAYYFTVFASFANCISIINETVTVYRIGDVNQSVSIDSRIKRVDQHEKVIESILAEKEEIENYSREAREYWLRKIETTICDYYVTTLLRFKDRKKGFQLANRIKKNISNKDKDLAEKLDKKFLILSLMHMLHIKEHTFNKLISMKLYHYLRKE